MARGSKKNIDDFVKDGNKVEKAFAEQVFLPGTFRYSEAMEDMEEHWDVMSMHTGEKFDVKGMKRRNRHEDPDETIHWVEVRSVTGELGWLYGEADWIVFIG
jgi:hypothetical protein